MNYFYKKYFWGVLFIVFFSFLFLYNVKADSFQIEAGDTDWDISTDGIYRNETKILCSSIVEEDPISIEVSNSFVIKNDAGDLLALINEDNIYTIQKNNFASLTYPGSISSSFVIQDSSNDVLVYVDENGFHYKDGLCTAQVCGNGIPEDPEECDDGNTVSNDGCSSECLIESCYGSPGSCVSRYQSYCDNGCTWNPEYSCDSDNDLNSGNCGSCGQYWDGTWKDNCYWYVEGGGITSFAGDTKILTIDGQKNISEIKENDLVLAYNEYKKEILTAPVSFTRQRLVQDYYNINNQIKVTGNHKFYTHRGLVKVENLNWGDLLYDGKKYVPIFSLQKIKEEIKVYTLGVDTYNNYFAEGVLVHNDHNHDLPTGCYGMGTDISCSNQYSSCLSGCQDNPNSSNACVECNWEARCIGTPLDNCDTFSTRSACVNRGCTWGVDG